MVRIIRSCMLVVCAFISTNVFGAPPANNDFSNATVLNGMRANVTASNVEATKEIGEPTHAANAGGASVWYKWTAPMSRLMTVSTSYPTTGFQTMIAIYTGNSVSTLNSINSNRTNSATRHAMIRFYASQGTTYYIAIDGFNPGSGAGAGTFKLQIMPGFLTRSSDFDVDGRADFSVFRPSTGTWYTELSGSNQIEVNQWGNSTDLPLPIPFANNVNNYVVYRPSEGNWYIRIFQGFESVARWGSAGDIPVMAEFGGDYSANPAIFRPSDGTWWMSPNSEPITFGLPGDIPIPGHYSNDGIADIAVFRPSNGTWYFRMRFSGQSGEDTFAQTQFGQAGDKPVPGDYDGDGVLDIAIYRPSTGVWWVRYSSNGQTSAIQFGLADDTPVSADFDADGLFDYAVFRPSTGTWYVLMSSTGSVQIKYFGINGDIPMTSPPIRS